MKIIQYIRLLLYRALDVLWIFQGKCIIFLFSKRKNIPLKEVEEIVIYRADRLWDAILSRPFLECFIRHIRSLGFEIPVRIIASSYNEVLLSPLAKLPQTTVEVIETDSMRNYDRSIFSVLTLFLRSFFFLFPRLYQSRSRTVLIDLVDSVSEMAMVQMKEFRSAFFCSANRWPFSLFFDSLLPIRFSGSSKSNLIENYIIAFSQYFWFEERDFKNFIEWNRSIFYPPQEQSVLKDILVFVGVKEIRNFPLRVWESFIHQISETFPDRTIHVSDMKNHAFLDILETKSWRKNVVFVRNTFSLEGLQEYAKNHAFVIGIDGGDINMMRPFTNSLTIFTFGNHFVWGPYNLWKTVENFQWENNWIFEATHVRGDRFAMKAYKQSFWLPSYQIPFDKDLIMDFDTKSVLATFKKLLDWKK